MRHVVIESPRVKLQGAVWRVNNITFWLSRGGHLQEGREKSLQLGNDAGPCSADTVD